MLSVLKRGQCTIIKQSSTVFTMAMCCLFRWCSLVAVIFCCLKCISGAFTIDYDKNTFLMDGQPFRYVSGSAHYFRMPHQYWRDRLRKLRAAGLNAVSTYVEWSQHERVPGQYDFDGDLDLAGYLRIAQEEDLFVLLRPGPYICAERDMGGLPYWLLTYHPDIYLRSSDPNYTKYVEKWISVLMHVVEPFLYGNGGPVILVQVENEYGSYTSCDLNYTTLLRDLFAGYVGDKAVLYTTDGAGTGYLKCGKIPGVYATVDFGPGGDVKAAFEAQRAYEPKGPLVNSEFYPGWLTHWGENMAYVGTQSVIKTLTEMLDLGASVNFYMFYGGTNFGFTAGANGGGDSYVSDITSYDYNAPLTEAGDLTEKYDAIREVLKKYMPPNNVSVKTSEKADYGDLRLKPIASLFAPDIRNALGVATQNEHPLSFEALGQNYGYCLYETKIPSTKPGDATLAVTEFHDYANIFVNDEYIDSLSRELKTNEAILKDVKEGSTLGILVENLGRINFGFYNNDTKGILGDVRYDDLPLSSWTMTSFELNDSNLVRDCYEDKNSPDCFNGKGPIFYMAKFVLNGDDSNGDIPLDTYVDVSNLKKGLIFVNGHNLGRYWSVRKPQYTLYLPGVFLNKSPVENVIIVMDEYLKEEDILLQFTTTPNFSYEKEEVSETDYFFYTRKLIKRH